MNKRAVFIALIVVIVAIFGGYKILIQKTGSLGGIRVDSTPKASVFLNDKLLGKTPLEDKRPSGNYVVKLLPDDSSTASTSWQGNITINPAVLTYMNRQLGVSELTSSGEILTLEKISGNEAQVSVFSEPNASTILLDGQEKGSTPTTFSVSVGEHDITVTSSGFVSRTTRIQATVGFKVNVSFQLALSGAEPSPTPTGGVVTPSSSAGQTNTTATGPSVVIKDTPTGFLRVRASASTSAGEIGQVKPGEKYPFLEEKDGWYKITYSEGKDGWVSSKYVEKSE